MGAPPGCPPHGDGAAGTSCYLLGHVGQPVDLRTTRLCGEAAPLIFSRSNMTREAGSVLLLLHPRRQPARH